LAQGLLDVLEAVEQQEFEQQTALVRAGTLQAHRRFSAKHLGQPGDGQAHQARFFTPFKGHAEVVVEGLGGGLDLYRASATGKRALDAATRA
jgi:hypothetical protein